MNTTLINMLSHPLSDIWPWYSLVGGFLLLSLGILLYDRWHLPLRQATATIVKKEERPAHEEMSFITMVNGVSVTMIPEPYLEPTHYRLHLTWEINHIIQDVSKEFYTRYQEGDRLSIHYTTTRLTGLIEIKECQ